MATVTKFASSNTVVTTGWTNPTNAYATGDAAYATAAPAKNSSITSDFGFAAFTTADIPDGATTNSVTYEIKYKSSTTSSTGAVVGVQGNNGGTLQGTESTFGMTLTDSVVTKVDATGYALADLRTAGTVLCRVRGARATSNTAITWSVDYVKVTVDYTPSSALAGTIAGTAGASGTLTGAGALAGSAAGAASSSATLSGLVLIAGQSDGAATATGTIAGGGALLGTAAGGAGGSGTLLAAGALAGTSSGAAAGSGTLAGAGTLSGSSSGVGGATGSLVGDGALAGDAAGTSTATLEVGGGSIRGQADGAATASATLTGAGALAGVVDALATAAAVLLAVGALAGVAAGTSACSADLRGAGELAATVAGSSLATGTLSTGEATLVGTASGSSTATGTLTPPVYRVLDTTPRAELVDASTRAAVRDTTTTASLEADPMIIRQNDTQPSARAQLLVDGAVPTTPLVGTVRFRLVLDGVTVFERAAVVESAATWTVRYDWQAGDTATKGYYDGFWIVDDGAGGVRTWPALGSQRVGIE